MQKKCEKNVPKKMSLLPEKKTLLPGHLRDKEYASNTGKSIFQIRSVLFEVQLVKYMFVMFVSGTKFLCSEVIAPVKSAVDDICLYIINFEDLSAAPTRVEALPSANNRLSKCKLKSLGVR